METQTLAGTLAKHPFLVGMLPHHVDRLASMAFEVKFKQDEFIFREGDESGFFYLLLSGKVALEVQAPARTFRIQVVGEGEELGWSSLLSPARKCFQARCLEPVTALAFDGVRLRGACDADSEFGYCLMKNVLGVVAERLQATRLQLLDVFKPVGSKMI